MKNPWEEISLTDYENHMKLDSVMQLQAMNEMMKGQFDTYSVSSVMILGIAGGNGLEHISKGKFERVYGVDVNFDYLQEVNRRYPDLEGLLECLCINLLNETDKLPEADLMIANLLIEYIGYECFQKAVQQADPKYVSCMIQIDTEEDWVSDSPYLHVFDGLDQVHHQIEEHTLERKMLEIGYHVIKSLEHSLPNGKKLVQIDFERTTSSKKERGAARLSTRQKTYAFVLLMIFLVVCTIMLSVKHEQKRLSEKMALQEEEPSEEVAVLAEEEKAEIESDGMIEQEEAESVKEEILYKHTLPGNIRMYYESEEISFVDEKTFALIREAYGEVEYSAEFEKGNPEIYEECKQKFWGLIKNEVPFLDRETGEEVYIKNWYDSKGWYVLEDFKSSHYSYYFFDMNGDGLPELCVDYCVFAYDPDTDQCILWTWLNGKTIVGTQKAIWYPDYDTDIYEFFQLDSDGNLELDTLFWAEHADWYHYDINMVMFPNYADSKKEWDITEEMKQQGVFEESNGQWFFRITDEQFEELEKPYKEAIEQARNRMREEVYSYEEMFGEYETSASDSVDYVDEKLYAEIKDICKSIDFTASFDPGDVTKYDLYKEKFKRFNHGRRLNHQLCWWPG